MNRILIIILSLLFSINSYSQNIKIGHKFIIELVNDTKSEIDFKIISIEPYNKTLELSKTDSLFEFQLKENQIQGVFGLGKFGKKVSSMLILKSGSPKILSYELKIKTSQNRKFIKTSTSSIFQRVNSIEYWPYQIKEIQFRKFEKTKFENQGGQIEIIEKIDSTCIKNTSLNLENGRKLFSEHLGLTAIGFSRSTNFDLITLLDYEKSLNSEDVSLGHYYSLGKGIYPNQHKFKFGNPLSYRRLECPVFDGQVSYFYTKGEKQVKVVSYEWSQFKVSDWPLKKETNLKEIRKEFEKKYDIIKREVISKLGKPLNINQEKNSGRIDTKWKSDNGIKAYLFMFEKSNRIRLYIYKE